MNRCFAMVQHPGPLCPRLRPLPSKCLPQTLHDLEVKLFIDCQATWNKLSMNDALPIKKLSISPSHLSDSGVLFWLWRRFYHPLRRLHLCFNIIAVHQRFITSYDILQKVFSSSRMIKQLVTDCETVPFVVNLSADTAQILRQHDASAVFRSNSYGTKFNTCPVFGNFRGCQATNHSAHFLNVIFVR